MNYIHNNITQIIGEDLYYLEPKEINEIIIFIYKRNTNKFKNDRLSQTDFNKLIIKYTIEDCCRFISQEIRERQNNIIASKTPKFKYHLKNLYENIGILISLLNEDTEKLKDTEDTEKINVSDLDIQLKTRLQIQTKEYELHKLNEQNENYKDKIKISKDDINNILNGI